ncbi:uncharacterized protein J3R85_003090 [Psidium guajava]|nr:uncharacterized protein J3R85_003090 [Psidium guajava]
MISTIPAAELIQSGRFGSTALIGSEGGPAQESMVIKRCYQALGLFPGASSVGASKGNLAGSVLSTGESIINYWYSHC